MYKKIFLSITIIGLTILPTISFISCSDKTINITYIHVRKNLTLSDFNTTITAIKKFEDITLPTKQDKINFVDALNSKVFSGIESGDLNKINTSYDELFLPTITLTAKSGYALNGVKNIKATPSEENEILNISSKVIHQITIDSAVNAYKNSSNDQGKVNALVTVFNGITISNLDKINVFLNESMPKSITLTTKEGYIFDNGLKKLITISIPDKILNINSKVVPQITIDSAVNDYKNSSNDQGKVNALVTVFNGITISNLDKINVSLNESMPKSITLTTKEGYIFDNGSIKLITTSNLIRPETSSEVEAFWDSYLPPKVATEEEFVKAQQRFFKNVALIDIFNFYRDGNIKLTDAESQSLNLKSVIGFQNRYPLDLPNKPSMASITAIINKDKYQIDSSSIKKFRHINDYEDFVRDEKNHGKTFLISNDMLNNRVISLGPWLGTDFVVIRLYSNLTQSYKFKKIILFDGVQNFRKNKILNLSKK